MVSSQTRPRAYPQGLEPLYKMSEIKNARMSRYKIPIQSRQLGTQQDFTKWLDCGLDERKKQLSPKSYTSRRGRWHAQTQIPQKT